MKILIILTLSTFWALSTSASIHENITKKWKELSDEFNLEPTKHGFCYLYDNKIYGQTAHLKSRLASTSKPITTLMALETLGHDFHYQTRVFSDGKNIHLQGSNDAMFSEEKIFYLIGALNALGIHRIDTLSFDQNTPIFAIALKERMSMSEAWYSKEYNIEQLKQYFNLNKNKKMKRNLRQFLKNTSIEKLNALGISANFSDYRMAVKKVIFNEKNPINETKEILQINSPDLITYLKFQNSVSHNWLADIMYKSFGGRNFSDWYLNNFTEENFGNDYYQKREGYKTQEASITLYTGSGLDSKVDDKRVDNYASCAIIVKTYNELSTMLSRIGENKGLHTVMPIAGIDIGTLKNRLNSKKSLGAIMAKTGTLMNTKSLAGKLKTKKGDIYFGFFHHVYKKNGADQYNAKIVQDLMTNYLIKEFGGASPINYKRPQDFFPIKEAMELEN